MSTTEKEVALRGPMASISVSIDWDVYQKIMYWVKKATGEVSGLGKVIIQEGGHLRVVSACLVKQENAAASTDMDAAAVAKAMYELREAPGHLNFWWHSHVNMAVFWSGTDTDTIREIGSNGWLVSTVFNKKSENRTAFYSKAEGVLPEIFLDNLPLTTPKYLKQSDVDAWDAEYVAKTVTKYSNYSNYSGGQFNRTTGKWEYPEKGSFNIEDTHDWVDGKWVMRKKHLTKKEKKALRPREKEASTTSSDATKKLEDGTLAEILDLKLVLDEIAGDFYEEEATLESARLAYHKIVGLVATSTLLDEFKQSILEEYELEFNQLFKDELAYEEDFNQMGYN